MELYKVLLVDDEEEIRMGISTRINWASLGLELVGEAANGEDALELAIQLSPDIVLTDIKMPFMDGLTLCQNLRTQMPTAKVVVFSGFDDFEYARKAIGMNVSQYILKPINAQELHEVLKELVAEISDQQAKRRNMETLRQSYDESLPVLRELFFTRLLDGYIDATKIEDRAARYELSLPQGFWITALVQLNISQGADERDELLLLSVKALFESQFSLTESYFHLFLYNDMIALLCRLPDDEINAFTAELERMCILSQSYLGLKLTVGVGRVRNDVAKLYLSAEEARSALDYRVVSQTNVIYLGDLEHSSNIRLVFEDADERELSIAVKLNGEDDISLVLGKLMQRVSDASKELAQCQQFFLELTICLMRIARSGNIAPETVFGKDFSGILNLTDFASLDAAMEWYHQCCLQLNNSLRAVRNDSNWHTIEQAKSFITENYSDSELCVESICAFLHLSPAYFSTLFKRETDKSFTSYVTEKRMDEALHLLRDTDEKTYLIAEKIGYSDPNYFSYVFKKQFGVSPSRFRTNKDLPKE